MKRNEKEEKDTGTLQQSCRITVSINAVKLT